MTATGLISWEKIQMSSPMILALNAGIKEQTRRLVKLARGPIDAWEVDTIGGPAMRTTSGRPVPEQPCLYNSRSGSVVCCPYGVVGDRLWVKESLKLAADQGTDRAVDVIEYVADGARAPITQWAWKAYKLSPIFMPRAACRWELELTNVRLERLQDISATDAIAEGVIEPSHEWDGNPTYPLARYRSLWIELHDQASWDANPWVWVLAFKATNRLISAAA